jgi:hypothetical protein
MKFGEYELNNYEHGELIAASSSHGFNPKFDRVVSRTSGGKLAGGVIYQGYMGTSVTMHVASWQKTWLTRDLLWLIFAYPFLQLQVTKCLGFVPTTNPHALLFDLRLGFVEEYRILDAVPYGDLVVISMRQEQCRWIQCPAPKVFRAAAEAVRQEAVT